MSIHFQEQRIPLVGYVHPQQPISPASMSAASDSDSMRKPSPSWPEYDSTKVSSFTTKCELEIIDYSSWREFLSDTDII